MKMAGHAAARQCRGDAGQAGKFTDLAGASSAHQHQLTRMLKKYNFLRRNSIVDGYCA
jgi:hypothetical protein